MEEKLLIKDILNLFREKLVNVLGFSPVKDNKEKSIKNIHDKDFFKFCMEKYFFNLSEENIKSIKDLITKLIVDVDIINTSHNSLKLDLHFLIEEEEIFFNMPKAEKNFMLEELKNKNQFFYFTLLELLCSEEFEKRINPSIFFYMASHFKMHFNHKKACELLGNKQKEILNNIFVNYSEDRIPDMIRRVENDFKHMVDKDLTNVKNNQMYIVRSGFEKDLKAYVESFSNFWYENYDNGYCFSPLYLEYIKVLNSKENDLLVGSIISDYKGEAYQSYLMNSERCQNKYEFEQLFNPGELISVSKREGDSIILPSNKIRVYDDDGIFLKQINNIILDNNIVTENTFLKEFKIIERTDENKAQIHWRFHHSLENDKKKREIASGLIEDIIFTLLKDLKNISKKSQKDETKDKLLKLFREFELNISLAFSQKTELNKTKVKAKI